MRRIPTLLLLLSLTCLNFITLFAQQPEDCGLPSPPGADNCEDACVYCDLTQNGYTGSTIGYTPDAPSDYCGTIENNQWFAFAAGTTTVEFTIDAYNCANGDGVQGAIYEMCAPFGSPVACDGGQNNGANIPIIVTANNLVVGQIYWFMVDGWLGDACDYDVTVTQGNTDPPPLDPPGPIDGGPIGCQGGTTTFSVPELPGASYYEWTLPDGTVVVGQDPFVDYTFGPAGQICVQANNVCNFSDVVCIDVEVVAPDAGTVTADTPLCPGETSNISVANYNTDPDFTQSIVVTDANGIIVQVTNSGTATFTHNECANFQVCTYNYVTADGTPPVVGEDINNIDCDMECCEIECQTLLFEDSEAPVFSNPPPNVTLTCFDEVVPMEDLTWTDNCDGTGTVAGTESGNPNLCIGGAIQRQWEYMDGCGNTVEYNQAIIVEPAPEATFENPPGDITVDCDNIPSSGVDLTYTNNGSGACLINGTVSPTESGNGDICGGTITYTWEFTDECSRTINHSQTVTITPADPPAFINPPADITVNCDNIPSSGDDLNYTNNESGDCLIDGTISPTESGSADICGGTITYTWQFVDPCGNNIQHQQNITVTPADPPAFINPPANVTVDCDNIPSSAPTLDYTNNGPGDCLIAGTVSPIESGNATECDGGVIRYTWEFTDPCGNTITHQQDYTVNPAPPTDFINPPGDMTVDCDNIPTSGVDLDYTNNGAGDCLFEGTISPVESGTGDICGGTITYTWDFTDPCGNPVSHTQTITITPADPPAFINPPANQNVNCDNVPTGAPDLNYTNNGPGDCLIEGAVSPTESGSADICGGTITYTWDFQDQCGNSIQHVQNITVDPPPPVQFLNPPTDITVECTEIPSGQPPALDYTNNGPGDCLFEGSAPAVESGSADECGGEIRYTWEYTDPCGNTITQIQNITVNPAPEPAFINPPADLTVSCDNVPSGQPPALDYTNNSSGSCLTEGSVNPTLSGQADICGGTITYDWEFTDPCGNTISHTQSITVDPAPEPAFINPPADLTVSCDNIPSGQPPALDYTNNGPGDCLIEGSVNPTQSGQADICGGTISYNWEFTDQCGITITHVQNITVDPAPDIAFLNPPPDQNVSCSTVPSQPGPLDYTNNGPGDCLIEGSVQPTQSGSYDECGGTISYTWTFTSQCDQTITHIQNINVDPAPEAAFTGPLPQNITVSCENVPGSADPLNYTNNETGICLISGSVLPQLTGSYDECGGTLSNTWQFTDDCGRTIQHQQIITVEPADIASFSNPPGSQTVSCDQVPATPPDLDYTNNSAGICAIAGSVPAIQSGSYNACGGSITYTWTFTDDCNRTISHSQNISVEPAPDPVFVDLPQDVTIDCNEDLPPPEDLGYTNNETGDCAIEGSVGPSVLIINDFEIEYTWTYTNLCNGNTITHTQNIVQDPPPEIFVQPEQIVICDGESFDLSTVSIIDQNNTNPVVTWHSGTPANSGNELPSTIVTPTGATTYYAFGTNNFGCSDEAPFLILLEPPPNAGEDGTGEICFSMSSGINLFGFLNGDPDFNGYWTDPNGTGVDLSNPFSVSLQGYPPGSYTFNYNVLSNGVCPESVSSVTLELLPEIIIDILEIICSDDPDFYEVLVNTNGFDITVNNGDVTDLGNNQISITNIPIDESLSIAAFNPGNQLCVVVTSISPPDCNCPPVDPPVNDGDQAICEGEPTPVLSVTVGPGETANWYDAPSGGTLLAQGTTTYTPNVTTPGVYTYYVEAENISTGCVSSILTPVQLEIYENPEANNASLELCDDDDDGFVTFDLSSANDQVNATPGSVFAYYESQSNAESGIDPLPVNYTNTITPEQMIFVVVTDPNGCTNIAELTLTVLPLPLITLDIEHEGCLGDSDGSVTINAVDGMNYSLDSISWTTENIFSDLEPGNYTAYVEGQNTCISSLEFTIDPGLELLLDQFQITCDNNETTSDPDDDFYTITFTVNTNQGGVGTYTLNDGNVDLGVYDYGSSNSLTLPADGQSFIFTFADDVLGCLIEESVGPLVSCSSDCLISLDQLDFICSDNGTSTDPSDDFYTVNILASVVNGSSNNTYNVFINNVLSYNFSYDIINTFTLPSDGSSPVITIEDNEFVGCVQSQIIGPLSPCSDDCIINAMVTNIVCDDMGTGNNPDDDTYSFNLIVTGENLSNGWQTDDGNYSGAYDVLQQLGPFLISDGDVTLVIMDEVNQICSVTTTAEAPEACSNCLPSVDAGPGGLLTCSDTTAQLSGSSTETGVYSWSGPNNFQSDQLDITVNESGWYYLEGVFAGACDALDSTFVDLDIQQPTANAGDDVTLTCQTTEVELNGSGSGSSGSVSYEWYNQGNVQVGVTPSITVTEAGTYTLIITDSGNGCSASSTVDVIPDADLPIADAGPPGILDCEILSYLLDGSNSSSGSNISYEWIDENSQTIGVVPQVVVIEPGIYTLIITDQTNDCQATASVEVTEDNILPIADAGPVGLLNCLVDTVLLDGSNSSGTGNLIYEWIDPNGDPIGDTQIIEVDEAGTYTLIITNENNNCIDESTVEVDIFTDIPTADVTSIGLIDCDNNEVVLDASTSSGNGPLEYEWFDANNDSIGITDQITVTSAGTYTVVITDSSNGCTNETSVDVEENAGVPSVNIESPELLTCDILNAILDASGSSGADSLLFEWFDPNNDSIGDSSIIEVSEPGTYTIILTNADNGCTSTAEVIVDQNILPPTADPGPPSTLTCTETTAILDAGSSSGNGILDFEWLDNDMDIIATTASTEVTQPGVYTIIVTDENGCTDSDMVEILISNETPIADAGPDQTLNCNISLIDLGGSSTSTGNNITYEWFDENNVFLGDGITISVNEPGTYTFVVTNADNDCVIIDEVVVGEDLINPQADAGPDGLLTCDVTSLTMGGTGTSVGTEYQYEWQNSAGQIISTDSLFDVTQPDTFTLIVTNNLNGCTAESEVIILEDVEVPISDAGIDQLLTCDDPTATLDGSNSSGNNIIFEWLDENQNTVGQTPVIEVGADGVYTLIITNEDNGCTAESTVEVSQDNSLPQIDAIADGILNCIVDSVLLDGSGSVSQSGSISFEWYNDSGQQISDQETAIANAPGTYTLIITDDQNGCTATMSVEVDQDINDPTADAGPDGIISCNDTEVTLEGTAGGGINFDYEWYDENNVQVGNTASVDVNAPGEYTLIITNTDNGCTATSTVTVTPDDIPVSDAGIGGTLTCEVDVVQLDGTGSSEGSDYIHQWFDENGNLVGTGLIINVTEPGIYTLVVTDIVNDCSTPDNVIVDQDINDPTAFINQVGALDCNNQSLVLDGSGSSPGGNVSFEWSTSNGNIISGANSPNPEIDEPGTYTLLVTDLTNGCTHTTSLVIDEDVEEPVVLINQPETLTCLVTQIIINANGSSSNGNFTYSWTSSPAGGVVSGGNTLTPTVNQAGTYTLTITNLDNGCESTGTITVDENITAPTAIANVNDGLDCITSSIQLDGTGSSIGSNYFYQWSGLGVVSGANTLEPTVNEGGIYTLLVTNTQNGCTSTAEVFVSDNNNVPSGLEVLLEPPLCFGDRGSIEVLEVQGGTPPYLYSFDGGDSFYPFTVFSSLEPGNYTILVQDAIGCEYQESFFIPPVPELIVDLGADIIIELGTSTTLNALVNIPNFQIDTIVWTPTDSLSCTDCLNPTVINPLFETLYGVTITDINGCTAQDEIMLRVRKERDIFIPNVFSPHNLDGINDVFMIFAGLGKVDRIDDFQIFDRWGELVFEDYDFQPNDPAHGWDGKLKGEPMNPAVFVYWARITFIDGVTILYKGDVTLVR